MIQPHCIRIMLEYQRWSENMLCEQFNLQDAWVIKALYYLIFAFGSSSYCLPFALRGATAYIVDSHSPIYRRYACMGG